MPRLYQGTMNGGEISPSMWGRVDSDRYASGVRVGRNVFFRPEGGVDKRPGMEYVGFGLESTTAPARLIPFKFNNEQTYIVVAQRDNIYFVKDGGVIVDDMDIYGGVGTPTVGDDANGVYVDYTTHGYNADRRLFWTSGGYDQLEGRWMKVATSPAPTANRFYLADYLTNANIQGDSFTTTYSASNPIEFGRIYTLGIAQGWFTDVEPSELDFTQANDKLYVSHPQEETKVITRGATDISWTIADFDPSPSVAAPTAVEGNYAEAFAKPAGTEALEYAITAIDLSTFEESLATLVTVSLIDPSVMVPPFPGSGLGAEIDITFQTGAEDYRIYKAIGGIYGLVGTVSMTSGTSTFGDYGITPNLSIAPPLAVEPEFNAADEYPGAVELFQQRIWFGRTNDKLRDIYASRSGSFSSFSTSTVGTDDDPIVQQIAAKSVHEVRYFIPLRDLVVLTSDGAWGFDTGEVGALSPTSGLVAQHYWGCARVKPVVVGNSAIYVEQSGRSVRDLNFDLQSDGFASSDLTLLAKHLFAGRTVVSMCYAENPYQMLFCVMSDGRGVSCTYVKDQQIFAWARHDTSGVIQDCATVTENGVDNIYLFTERSADDAISTTFRWRQIERMKMVDSQFVDQGVYLDNSKNLGQGDGWEPPVTLYYPRITDGELELHIEDTVVDDSLIQIHGLEGTTIEAMEGLTFVVDKSDISQSAGGLSGYDWYRVFRHENGTEASKEIFEWEDYLPDNHIEWQATGVYSTQTTVLRKLHHLYWRGSVVDIRAEGTMYENQSIDGDGVGSIATPAAIIHVGEDYISEIETLDLDDVNDPITNLPIQIGQILYRFELCNGFYSGRERAQLADRSDLTETTGFDKQKGGFSGIVESLQTPDWTRSGRVICRSYGGFPWKLTAIIISVEAGDLDA